MTKDEEIEFLNSRILLLHENFRSTEAIVAFMVERIKSLSEERKRLLARILELEAIIKNTGNTNNTNNIDNINIW